MKYQYVIEYNPRSIHVERVDGYYGLIMKNWYDEAIERYSRLTYGDVVPWNNSFWWITEAENAKEALDKFVKLREEEG